MPDDSIEEALDMIEVAVEYHQKVLETFTPRELRLITNCIQYAAGDPAGLPGHNLMIIVDKLVGFTNFVIPPTRAGEGYEAEVAFEEENRAAFWARKKAELLRERREGRE